MNARKKDPCTSHEAVKWINKSLIVLARDLVRQHPSRTYQQLFHKHVMDANRRRSMPRFSSAEALMKRLHDAEVRGLVIPGAQVTCPITVARARTWHAR